MMHFRKNKQERSEPADLTNADVTSAETVSDVTPDLSLDTSAQAAPMLAQDWEVENSSLSAEEAEEIRAAFQQVLAMEEAPASAPLSMDEVLELTIDPLDLRDYDTQVDLIDSFVPEDLDTAAVATHAPATTSLVDDVVVAAVPDTEIDRTLTDSALTDTALTEAIDPPLEAAEEPICVGFQESAQAVEQIALAVDETDLAAATVEAEIVASDWPLDRDEAIAVDAIVETETHSLIDSITLVDMGMETEELAVPANSSDAPLTYFQYYLDDDSEDADGADYNQTTWRQPSVPAGLIGAGVLGATLISGFMIADSLKQSPNTQAKKPTSPSPLQALNPQGQTAAMATPKPAAPETMKPEVPLPPAPPVKTDTLAMAPLPATMLPPLPTMIEPNVMTTRSLDSGKLAAGTTSNGVGLQELKVGKAVAAPETLPVPPNPQIAPINSEVTLNQPQMVAPVIAAAAQSGAVPPRTSRGPVFEAVNPPTPTVGVVPGAPTVNPRVAAPTTAQLPQLEAGVEGTAADLQTVAKSIDLPSPESPVTPVNPLPDAANQSVFVPVETVSPAMTALPPSPQELSKGTPTELIYRQEAPNPTVQGSQPAPTVPPAASTVDPSLQSLLTAPAPGFSVTGASLRSLTQAEATAVAQASQLGAFSRQSLEPKAYVQAYRSVSQQLNALPPFGFIDYQRQMILLPTDIAASLNQVDGQFNKPQMAQTDAVTVANKATQF
jgi:hypothetical protein